MTRFNLFFLNIGWVPCWSRLQTKATHAKPCCKRRLTEHGQRGFVLLASMLVSSFRGGHHGKGTVGIHVGCHVGFHVGFQLPGYGGGHHRKDTGWVPCWRHVSFQWTGCSRRTFPCWLEVLGPLRLPLGQRRNLKPGYCPRGFGTRWPRPHLPLLGRSPRASGRQSHWDTPGFQVRFDVDVDPTGDAKARGLRPNRGSSGSVSKASKASFYRSWRGGTHTYPKWPRMQKSNETYTLTLVERMWYVCEVYVQRKWKHMWAVCETYVKHMRNTCDTFTTFGTGLRCVYVLLVYVCEFMCFF